MAWDTTWVHLDDGDECHDSEITVYESPSWAPGTKAYCSQHEAQVVLKPDLSTPEKIEEFLC